MKRKIKKLIFRPVKFFKDSWLFDHNILEEHKKTKNLFVISHLGQLAQIEAVIKREKLLNCVLVILYTKKNKTMPKMVRDKSTKSLFNRVLLLEIPSFPNKINIKNLVKINNSYQKMIDEINPHRLFILSFEKHYCLLASYAKKKGILVNLVEEGTATYKYDNYEQANQAIIDSFSKEEKRKAFLIRTMPIFKELRPVLNIHRDFNTIYAVYPKALASIFNAKHYVEFFLYENIKVTNEIEKVNQEYNIGENDIIFLNQRYPFPQDLYASSLISSLVTHFGIESGQKIFIKLHPKDSEELKEALKREIELNNYQENIILIDRYGFLVEGLIALSKPKYVSALTSTGLVYSSKISPRTRSVSIYPKLKSKLLESISYSDKVFKESDEHFYILQKFDNILFVE